MKKSSGPSVWGRVFARTVCVGVCAVVLLTGCGGSSDSVKAVPPALEPEVIHGMNPSDTTVNPSDNPDTVNPSDTTAAYVPADPYANPPGNMPDPVDIPDAIDTSDYPPDAYEGIWDTDKYLPDADVYSPADPYPPADTDPDTPPDISNAYSPGYTPTDTYPSPDNYTGADISTSRRTRKRDLIVFASSSLRGAISQLARSYEWLEPDVNVTCVFGSSGELLAQIKEGAECDVFIPASAALLDELDGSIMGDRIRNPDNLSYILPESRMNLLENHVVLAVPTGNPAALTGFYQLSQLLRSGRVRLAMGSPDSAVGQYAAQILAYYHIGDRDGRACMSYGTGAEEVTAQIVQGLADCGIVYATDAYAVKTGIVAEATDKMCGTVLYPAAALNRGANPEQAQIFLRYLRGSDAQNVFEELGFIYLPARQTDGESSGNVESYGETDPYAEMES